MKMETTILKISLLSPNDGQIEGLPKNPRFIRDERFLKLVKSIQELPEMLELRELIVIPHGKKYIIIGGNMRFRAMKELGYTEAPCKVLNPETPAKVLREITIKDNVGYGSDDTEALANEWNLSELEDWGMELPSFDDFEEEQETISKEDEEEEKVEWIPDCLFASDNIYDIPVLKMSKENVYVQLPFKPYGADARTKTGVGTYHFYVDDYRFNAIWNDPTKIINSGCQAIVEPNCSLYETTPIGYGIFLIYKKRWISRMLQDYGIDVFVDLNVTEKFQKYNVMGIPKGYNAFFTRGYDNRINLLEQELQIAKDISGLDNPNFCVYGGSKKVKDFCNANSLTYVENSKLDL